MEKKKIFKANAFNLKVFIYLIIVPQNIWSKSDIIEERYGQFKDKSWRH